MQLSRTSDLVALVAGLVAVAATFIWAAGADAAAQPLLVLGALLVVSSLWSLLGAGGAGSWVTAAFGALLLVSPWAFGFADDVAAAWTAWITGGVTVIVGLWTAVQTRSDTPAHV